MCQPSNVRPDTGHAAIVLLAFAAGPVRAAAGRCQVVRLHQDDKPLTNDQRLDHRPKRSRRSRANSGGPEVTAYEPLHHGRDLRFLASGCSRAPFAGLTTDVKSSYSSIPAGRSAAGPTPTRDHPNAQNVISPMSPADRAGLCRAKLRKVISISLRRPPQSSFVRGLRRASSRGAAQAACTAARTSGETP